MQRRQLSRYSQPNIMCSHIPSLAELSMVLISGDADRWIDYLDSDQMDQYLYCQVSWCMCFE